MSQPKPMHQNLALAIDHTLLKPEATRGDIRLLCAQARDYGFAAVCVMPYFVPLAKQLLTGTDVKIATVIGFPLGSTRTEIKADEARDAISVGADELDMVMQVGLLKEGDHQAVMADMKAVVQAAAGRTVKVIVETSLLTSDELITACRLAVEAGALFVKTSTGFSSGGAVADDVALMRRTVGPRIGVKASGGIRTRKQALAMLEAGANRLGTSNGVALVAGEAVDSTPGTY